MQNILFVVMALPQYLLMTARANRHPTHAPPPLNWVDGVIAATFLTVLVIEEIGDNQQQEYQVRRRSPLRITSAEVYSFRTELET